MTEISQADVRALLDKAQIHDTLMRYSRAVDRGDGELLLACFHSGATLDYGRGPMSADALADAIKQMIHIINAEGFGKRSVKFKQIGRASCRERV